MVTTALQRSNLLRCQYLIDMSIYQGHPELFVFVDETGADRRDSMRKFAYSMRGQPAVVSKLMVHGQRVSAIVGMSCDGILDFITSKSTNTSLSFFHYIEKALVPYLQPFNGVNARSVVVLDNTPYFTSSAKHRSSSAVPPPLQPRSEPNRVGFF